MRTAGQRQGLKTAHVMARDTTESAWSGPADGAPAGELLAEQKRVAALDARVTSLQARAWQNGWVLQVAPSGGFLASRWGRTVDLAALEDAEAFFARLGKAQRAS